MGEDKNKDKDLEDKDISEMTEQERQEYYQKIGVKPKSVEEYDTEDEGVEVVEKSEEEKKKEEERKEEELEQYREVSGF